MWTHLKGSLTFSVFVLRCEEFLVVWKLLGSISAFVTEPLSVGLEDIWRGESESCCLRLVLVFGIGLIFLCAKDDEE